MCHYVLYSVHFPSQLLSFNFFILTYTIKHICMMHLVTKFDHFNFQMQKEKSKTNPRHPQIYDFLIKIYQLHYTTNSTLKTHWWIIKTKPALSRYSLITNDISTENLNLFSNMKINIFKITSYWQVTCIGFSLFLMFLFSKWKAELVNSPLNFCKLSFPVLWYFLSNIKEVKCRKIAI